MRHGVLIIAAATAALATPPIARAARPVQPSPVASSSCVGTWDGAGVQPGYPPWAIEMVVTAATGASCGTIEYPSLGCGGFLEQCVVHHGRAYLRERYTRNPGTCAPAGRIEARCTGDQMDWTWRGQEVVRTTLRRRP